MKWTRLFVVPALVVVVWAGQARAAAPIPEVQVAVPAPVDKARVKELGKTLQELLKGEEYELAAEVCVQIVGLDPENPGSHYTQALVLARAGKTDAAFAALEKAKGRGFNDAFGLVLNNHAYGLQDDKRFGPFLDGILVANRVSAPIMNVRLRQGLLGQAHLRIAELLGAKEFDKAALIIRVMESVESGYPLIEYSKARLNAAQGKKDEAFAHLAKSIEQGMADSTSKCNT